MNGTPAPQTNVSRVTPAPGSTRDLLQSTAIRVRFEQVLGNPTKAAQFVAALSTLVYASPQLKSCEPNTIIAAAVQAAALDLAIDPNLGQAHIVPYGSQARFQIGWKGYVQLALRTAQYSALNVAHVYEGEIEIVNRFTGEIKFAPAKSEKVVGVVAYLKMLNGFEKFDYWTLEKIESHAKKFSKSYGSAIPSVVAKSGWTTNPEAMQKKTVLLDLLRKWGVMSVEMRQALATEAPAEEPEPTNGNGHASAANKAALFGEDDDAPTAAKNAAADQAIADAEKVKA
jgi:recombination protein RecT